MRKQVYNQLGQSENHLAASWKRDCVRLQRFFSFAERYGNSGCSDDFNTPGGVAPPKKFHAQAHRAKAQAA